MTQLGDSPKRIYSKVTLLPATSTLGQNVPVTRVTFLGPRKAGSRWARDWVPQLIPALHQRNSLFPPFKSLRLNSLSYFQEPDRLSRSLL